MADPVGFVEVSSSTGITAFRGADLPGGLYNINVLAKNNAKVAQCVNKAIPSGSTITVKQLLTVFTKDIDTSDLPAPKPGPIKVAKFSNGFVLQDAQVNDMGQMQFTFLNSGMKGTDPSQVAAIQLAGRFGTGDPAPGNSTMGGTITFLFALK